MTYKVGDFVYFNCGINGNNYGRIIDIQDNYYVCKLLYNKHGGTEVPQNMITTDEVIDGYKALQNDIDFLQHRIDIFKNIEKKERQVNKC